MTNLERVREKMREKGISAILMTDMANIAWLTGFSGSFGFVLLSQDQARFLTDSRYTIQAGEQVKEMPVAWYQSPTTSDDFIASQIHEMGFKQLCFESAHVTYATFERLRDKLSGVELKGSEDIFSALRMIKTPDEIARVRSACGLADACFAHVSRLIMPGVTEWDVSMEIEFFIRRSGHALAFDVIAVSGENSARPHGHATEKKLEVGDFLTLDFGAKVDGYCSDITRTVVIGEATDRHREIYGQVLKAQLACLDAMKPGARAADIDALARAVFDEIGLAKYFGHGLGHGLGSLVHDAGRMNATSQDILEPGQIWTVEPGVYLPGFGGVRIEDDAVITETGIEILTHAPKGLMVLPG